MIVQPPIGICTPSAIRPTLRHKISCTRVLHASSTAGFFADCPQFLVPMRSSRQIAAVAAVAGTQFASRLHPRLMLDLNPERLTGLSRRTEFKEERQC